VEPSVNLFLQRPDAKSAHRKQATFYARVWWPDTKTRAAYSLKVHTEEEATVAFRIWKRDILPGLIEQHARDVDQARLVPKGAQTAGPRLSDLVAWYTETHLPYLGRAEKTILHYSRVLRDFQTFCGQRNIGRAQQLGTKVIEEWQIWLSKFRPSGDTRVARRDELLALRHFLEECHEAGEIEDLPKISWRIPGKNKSSRFRALSLPELADFLTKLRDYKSQLYLATAWTAHSGWRISDVLDFRVKEVLESGCIDREQLKTSKRLLYPMNPMLQEILSMGVDGRTPAPDDHVFLDESGEPWGYHKYKKHLEYFCSTRFGGVNVSPRDLRKTFGSLQAISGCPPSILKELMGHEDVTMTLEFYVDVDLASMAQWSTRLCQSLNSAMQPDTTPKTTERVSPKPRARRKAP
jgi:integrase